MLLFKCDADFRPSNILLELKNLDGLEEEEVLSLLGEPKTTDVHVRKDSRPTPEVPYAPRYLVYPVDFEAVDPSFILPRMQIVDFGQSFDVSEQPRPEAYGIPVNYAAPEVVIDNDGGIAMDLWSLACTLYEIQLGKRLFNVFQLVGLRKEDYVDEIASLLGEPPEVWAEYYDESDTESEDSEMTTSDPSDEEETLPTELSIGRARRIQQKLGDCHRCVQEGCTHPRFELIPEVEAATMADLWERLLRYQPEDRHSAQDLLEHEWFQRHLPKE